MLLVGKSHSARRDAVGSEEQVSLHNMIPQQVCRETARRRKNFENFKDRYEKSQAVRNKRIQELADYARCQTADKVKIAELPRCKSNILQASNKDLQEERQELVRSMTEHYSRRADDIKQQLQMPNNLQAANRSLAISASESLERLLAHLAAVSQRLANPPSEVSTAEACESKTLQHQMRQEQQQPLDGGDEVHIAAAASPTSAAAEHVLAPTLSQPARSASGASGTGSQQNLAAASDNRQLFVMPAAEHQAPAALPPDTTGVSRQQQQQQQCPMALGVQLDSKPLLQPMNSDFRLMHKLPDIKLLTLTTVYDGDSTDFKISEEYIPAGRDAVVADSKSEPAMQHEMSQDITSSAAVTVAALKDDDVSGHSNKNTTAADTPVSLPSADLPAASAGSLTQQPEAAQTLQHVVTACQQPGSAIEVERSSTPACCTAPSQHTVPLSASVPNLDSVQCVPISLEEREAAAAAGCEARQHKDELFQAINVQQQQQEKQQALKQLAAAGAVKAVISVEERKVLREAGRAAHQAAHSQLAAALQESDEVLQEMDEESRLQWFKGHACETAEDVENDEKRAFEAEWKNLPPEFMAMVEELQSRQ